jgi:hypothetical protein
MFTGPHSLLFGPLFRAKRADPARLGPMRARFEQKIEPVCLVGPDWFCKRA